ncbi:primase homolog protein-like [Pistacia vera]|uniref:primase homolog protein-like n=1 Tax=Pistacia vera TaxID=55513 RepID=UPI00126306A6|nr:primase homolog protein-like [Pistacia vera]
MPFDNKVELTEKVSGIDSNLKLEKVNQKLELVGIICNDSCIAGQYNCLFCPQAFAVSNNNAKVFSSKQMTEKSLGLEPLGDKLIACFAEWMISKGTLQRNSVMQLSGDQERITEKWLFGLDDIKEAAEIIIVESEIDKLAMEEAGFLNC